MFNDMKSVWEFLVEWVMSAFIALNWFVAINYSCGEALMNRWSQSMKSSDKHSRCEAVDLTRMCVEKFLWSQAVRLKASPMIFGMCLALLFYARHGLLEYMLIQVILTSGRNMLSIRHTQTQTLIFVKCNPVIRNSFLGGINSINKNERISFTLVPFWSSCVTDICQV